MQAANLDEWTRILISGQWKNGERPRYPYPSYWEELAKQPDAALPAIGAYWERENNFRSGGLMEIARGSLNDTRQLFPNAPERSQILAVLRALDRDYELLRQDVELIPSVRALLQAGNGIVPDLSSGRYRWVKTAAPEKETQEFDELKVDLFFNDELYKSNLLLPIFYNEQDEVNLAEFVGPELPRQVESSVMRVYVESQATAEARKSRAEGRGIPWQKEIRPRRLPYTKTQIQEMKKSYVAINVTEAFPYPFMFRCAICHCEAHLANRHLMETFCSEVCHTDYLSRHV